MSIKSKKKTFRNVPLRAIVLKKASALDNRLTGARPHKYTRSRDTREKSIGVSDRYIYIETWSDRNRVPETY